jgi:hypothetical protein
MWMFRKPVNPGLLIPDGVGSATTCRREASVCQPVFDSHRSDE